MESQIDPHLGQIIRGYSLEEALGSGKVTMLYRAHTEELWQLPDLVIMLLRVPETFLFAQKQKFLERFEQEAKRLIRLRHPSLFPLYGYGKDEDDPYLIIPEITGETLRRQIRKRGAWEVEEAFELLSPIGMALDYIHEHGLAYQFLNPTNILLQQDKPPQITNLNIPQIVRQTGLDLTDGRVSEYDHLRNIAGDYIGMAEYLSPEVIKGKEPDPRSDIYSLGILLYEMLSGSPPFTGETYEEVALKHVKELPPSLRKAIPDIPTSLELLINRALHRNPEHRFQTAGDFIHAFERVLGGKMPGARAYGAGATVAARAASASHAQQPASKNQPEAPTTQEAQRSQPAANVPERSLAPTRDAYRQANHEPERPLAPTRDPHRQTNHEPERSLAPTWEQSRSQSLANRPERSLTAAWEQSQSRSQSLANRPERSLAAAWEQSQSRSQSLANRPEHSLAAAWEQSQSRSQSLAGRPERSMREQPQAQPPATRTNKTDEYRQGNTAPRRNAGQNYSAQSEKQALQPYNQYARYEQQGQRQRPDTHAQNKGVTTEGYIPSLIPQRKEPNSKVNNNPSNHSRALTTIQTPPGVNAEDMFLLAAPVEQHTEIVPYEATNQYAEQYEDEYEDEEQYEDEYEEQYEEEEEEEAEYEYEDEYEAEYEEEEEYEAEYEEEEDEYEAEYEEEEEDEEYQTSQPANQYEEDEYDDRTTNYGQQDQYNTDHRNQNGGHNNLRRNVNMAEMAQQLRNLRARLEGNDTPDTRRNPYSY